MQKRRILPLFFVGLLVVVCLAIGSFVASYRHEQAGRQLIRAIKSHDTLGAMAALRAQADPNSHELGDVPIS